MLLTVIGTPLLEYLEIPHFFPITLELVPEARNLSSQRHAIRRALLLPPPRALVQMRGSARSRVRPWWGGSHTQPHGVGSLAGQALARHVFLSRRWRRRASSSPPRWRRLPRSCATSSWRRTRIKVQPHSTVQPPDGAAARRGLARAVPAEGAGPHLRARAPPGPGIRPLPSSTRTGARRPSTRPSRQQQRESVDATDALAARCATPPRDSAHGVSASAGRSERVGAG